MWNQSNQNHLCSKTQINENNDRLRPAKILLKATKYIPVVRKIKFGPDCFKKAKISKKSRNQLSKCVAKPKLVVSIPLCDNEPDTACTNYS